MNGDDTYFYKPEQVAVEISDFQFYVTEAWQSDTIEFHAYDQMYDFDLVVYSGNPQIVNYLKRKKVAVNFT